MTRPIDPDALSARAVRFLEESIPEWDRLTSSEQLGMTTDLAVVPVGILEATP